MTAGDTEIPSRGVVFSPKVLFSGDASARDVELVIGGTIQGADLANQGLRLRRGVTDLVQHVQGDGSSDESGGGDKPIQIAMIMQVRIQVGRCYKGGSEV